MTPRNRTPNDLLRLLLKEARWTNHNFALAVNRVAAEAGARLHYDRTSVSHWLSGTRPRPSVAAFAAEALSRRLGRPVSTEDTGLADRTGAATTPAPGRHTALTALHHLLEQDQDPRLRAVLHEQPFRSHWSAVPPWRPRPEGRSPDPDADGPPGGELVAALGTMASTFAAADEAFGGGHARTALVTYLADDVVRWLRSAASGPFRGELVSSVAALTHLVGSMSFDDLHHHLAQYYYRVTLLLADEVGDSTGHALVLRGMSTQACFLGHYRQAAQLADAAVDRLPPGASPGTRAVLLGQATVAHAALADRRTAFALLGRAEKFLGKAEDEPPATGRTDQAEVEYLAGRALAFLLDHEPAEAALRESLEHRPERERRSRLLTTHYLAELQLRRGNPELACTTWQRFLDECGWVRSGRVRSALHAFSRQLQPYRGNVVVRHALRRAERLAGRSTGAGGLVAQRS
ncbi:tol-pal system YbgF family protein [Actinosynnema sp. NPDC053489]|uniref:tol-pal system YbgF family protein n=1 Tax=Actinosynnema sp. NPDC053489 TaxID=3363916 RepID=UPI0037CA392B